MFLSKSLTERVLLTTTYVFQNFEEIFRPFIFLLSWLLQQCLTNVLLLLQAFAIFCGMAIHNTVMYENVNKAMAKQKVALEVRNFFLNISFFKFVALWMWGTAILLLVCYTRDPLVQVEALAGDIVFCSQARQLSQCISPPRCVNGYWQI